MEAVNALMLREWAIGQNNETSNYASTMWRQLQGLEAVKVSNAGKRADFPRRETCDVIRDAMHLVDLVPGELLTAEQRTYRSLPTSRQQMRADVLSSTPFMFSSAVARLRGIRNGSYLQNNAAPPSYTTANDSLWPDLEIATSATPIACPGQAQNNERPPGIPLNRYARIPVDSTNPPACHVATNPKQETESKRSAAT